MKVDTNDIRLHFAFGEKEDFYFAHVIDNDGSIIIEMKYSKDLYNRSFAFRLATMVYNDTIC